MSRRENEARARLICALWKLAHIAALGGYPPADDEVINEIKYTLDEVDAASNDRAGFAILPWYDAETMSDANREDTPERLAWWAVEDALTEVLRCRGRC